MSLQAANDFLAVMSYREDLREFFQDATTPQEFAKVAEDLGYPFTPDELKTVVEERSRGVTRRRHTGIWEWLRTVPWIDRENSASGAKEADVEDFGAEDAGAEDAGAEASGDFDDSDVADTASSSSGA